MAAFPYCLMLSFVLFSLTPPTLSSPSSLTIPVSFSTATRQSDPLHSLTNIATMSLARARHLKNPQNAPNSTTPLFPYSGAYSISLSFGTPPQSIPLVLDTGSSFSWLPCTRRYICRNCSASATGISSFLPKESSSAKFLGCMNPKCHWIHKSFDPSSSCQDCRTNSVNCTQICPPYILLYGTGSTGGIAMVETLTMPYKKVPNFVVGCSLFALNQPAGVAGFGRGTSSFPSQLGLKKFSYCLVSHKFDNTPKSSYLSMDADSDSGQKRLQFIYTPLLKNPVRPGNSGLLDYYYVGLRKITVGGTKVGISYNELVPDADGDGGTIVDSGSTFTYMSRAIFTSVADAFARQVKGYGRAEAVEALTGLRPCFDVTGNDTVTLPDLKLHFKGGAEMTLPLENYFFAVSDDRRSIVCLTVVSDNTRLGPELVGGPSVILGNFLMQNFQVEFDLRNERFGFRQQSCSDSG